MERVLQCVAFRGASSSVKATRRSTAASLMVRGAPERGPSISPSNRCSAKRRRHVATVGRLRPRVLATPRFVAPGSAPDARLARGIEILTGFGLVVELGAHVHDKFGYLAGTDADRLADLDAAFRDPGIRGVFAARGGYGTQRIVDGLDLAAVRRDPRVFVGFSDLTALSGRLWRGARLASF